MSDEKSEGSLENYDVMSQRPFEFFFKDLFMSLFPPFSPYYFSFLFFTNISRSRAECQRSARAENGTNLCFLRAFEGGLCYFTPFVYGEAKHKMAGYFLLPFSIIDSRTSHGRPFYCENEAGPFSFYFFFRFFGLDCAFNVGRTLVVVNNSQKGKHTEL